ncbi:MAG: TIGR04282 family arsenosugar biosynthesis glycosyltransferase [Thermoleophilaceae bacterium]
MIDATLLVIAKAPVAGRVKTRLCPPCTPTQAAAIAQAALRDTFAAVADTPVMRRLVVLDGDPPGWLPAGLELETQRGDGLAERLAAAFEGCAGPAFLVGMDTPQVTPALLTDALRRLTAGGADAVLGPTRDGGYWGIGLRRRAPEVFTGVPMSTPRTLAAQTARLAEAGLRPQTLETLEDVDTIEDALRVAATAPTTRFAAALSESGHVADGQQPVPEAAA